LNKQEEKQATIRNRQLTIREQSAIEKMKQRTREEMGSPFRVKSVEGKEVLEIAIDPELKHSDAVNKFNANIMEITGASNSSMGIDLLVKAGNSLTLNFNNVKETVALLENLAHSMRSLAPQDEYEGQLIAQLVVLHNHAMNWLGKAHRTDRVDFANTYLNAASKLLTRHHETLDALIKYRRRGEQRVYVEHVHVHEGAQAIVGNVNTRGGEKGKNEEGPHAKV